jgi:hypothetical protein
MKNSLPAWLCAVTEEGAQVFCNKNFCPQGEEYNIYRDEWIRDAYYIGYNQSLNSCRVNI